MVCMLLAASIYEAICMASTCCSLRVADLGQTTQAQLSGSRV